MLKLFPLFIFLFAAPLNADPTPHLEGHHKNWIHQSCTEGKKKTHYIISQPTKSTGKYKKRGEVYLMVTREGKKDVVSFVAGYSYKKGSSVSVRFDKGKTFKLFTDGDRAWAENEATDKNIIAELKKRNSLTVKGESSLGTKTDDHVSLSGFSAAYKSLK